MPHLVLALPQLPPASQAAVKVKVFRDLEKKPVEGVYPSRGYAFAEFPHHAYALAALRHVNNNPAFSSYAQGGGGKKAGRNVPRLIVSFAVEVSHGCLRRCLEQRGTQRCNSPSAPIWNRCLFLQDHKKLQKKLLREKKSQRLPPASSIASMVAGTKRPRDEAGVGMRHSVADGETAVG